MFENISNWLWSTFSAYKLFYGLGVIVFFIYIGKNIYFFIRFIISKFKKN